MVSYPTKEAAMTEPTAHPRGLHIPAHRRPRVLLLGNGLNRVYGGASWAGLLEKINRTPYTTEQVKALPFPLQAVLLSRDHVDVSLQDLQQELTQCQVHPWLAEQLHRLLALPFDCILTPNFTYEIQCALFPDFLDHPQRFLRHTPAVPRAEQHFMLHTYYALPLERGEVPLFHVHGEARCPDTVILGHYYYGNLLFCCDEYLTHRAPELRYPLWPGSDGLEALSWLDYFILGDVYSLGFGFDTSEMDLWWLLCRKKRERAPHGGLWLYEPARRSAETKQALLEAYQTHCISLGFQDPRGEDYKAFYEAAVKDLTRRLKDEAGQEPAAPGGA